MGEELNLDIEARSWIGLELGLGLTLNPYLTTQVRSMDAKLRVCCTPTPTAITFAIAIAIAITFAIAIAIAITPADPNSRRFVLSLDVERI